MNHHSFKKPTILYEITDQLYAITPQKIGNAILTVIISPLLLIGMLAGFCWFLIRGIIAVLIVGFKKGNRNAG